MVMLKSAQCVFAALSIFFLVGCKSAEETAFIEDCQTQRGYTKKQCNCLNDLISDGLDDKGQRYVRSVVIGDQSAAAKIQSSFGLIEGTTILARASWIATNSEQACGAAM